MLRTSALPYFRFYYSISKNGKIYVFLSNIYKIRYTFPFFSSGTFVHHFCENGKFYQVILQRAIFFTATYSSSSWTSSASTFLDRIFRTFCFVAFTTLISKNLKRRISPTGGMPPYFSVTQPPTVFDSKSSSSVSRP